MVAWHSDRLHRSPVELETFISTVEAAGIDVETARAVLPRPQHAVGKDGCSSARGGCPRPVSNTRPSASVASTKNSPRLASHPVVARGPSATKPTAAPYDECEALVVREAAERVLQGESIRSICRNLTARGVGTVKGGTWAPTVLRNLLLSARISGRREHGRRDPGTRSIVAAPITSETAECGAIITPEVSDRIREVLAIRLGDGYSRGTRAAACSAASPAAGCVECPSSHPRVAGVPAATSVPADPASVAAERSALVPRTSKPRSRLTSSPPSVAARSARYSATVTTPTPERLAGKLSGSRPSWTHWRCSVG